jgi:hypothetical protein
MNVIGIRRRPQLHEFADRVVGLDAIDEMLP